MNEKFKKIHTCFHETMQNHLTYFTQKHTFCKIKVIGFKKNKTTSHLKRSSAFSGLGNTPIFIYNLSRHILESLTGIPKIPPSNTPVTSQLRCYWLSVFLTADSAVIASTSECLYEHTNKNTALCSTPETDTCSHPNGMHLETSCCVQRRGVKGWKEQARFHPTPPFLPCVTPFPDFCFSTYSISLSNLYEPFFLDSNIC